ncbi:MAG TPA: amidase family protein [Thermoleophilaceae bacterium]|nr:amidase family protein [Thermoleophilaceae bacterium]
MRRIDATAHADLVRAGETSPRELVEAAIERVESMNGELNAVIHPLFDKALADEPADGPFRGVPIVVKDLVAHTAGDRSTSGSGCCARSSRRSPRTRG